MDTHSYDDFDKAAALGSKMALSYGVTTVAAMECRGAQAAKKYCKCPEIYVVHIRSVRRHNKCRYHCQKKCHT